MKSSRVICVSGVVILVVGLSFFKLRPDGETTLEQEQSEKVEDSNTPRFAERLRKLQNDIRRGHAERLSAYDYYDPDRDSLEDPEFAKRYAQHQAIKQYLSLPRRKEPAYQKMLEELHANGYGLQHWLQAGRAIVSSQVRLPARRAYLTKLGKSEAEIAETIRRERDSWPEARKRVAIGQVVKRTGITDEKLIESLFESPIVWDIGENPFGLEQNASPVRGEQILTDADWMPGNIQEIVQERGAPDMLLPDIQTRLTRYQQWKASKLREERGSVTNPATVLQTSP